MGLAAPRKRVKLSHDPRNSQWSQAPDSFGARIMQSSGWKPGTALGASSVPIPVHESSAAKVKIAVKDDTLGLGASLKSKNVEHQRTGLDAFQGLLGRLNAKDEQELKKVEEKIENRKLALCAQGRWGGMIFVPGGLLLQEDPKLIAKQDDRQTVHGEADENSQAINQEGDEEAQKQSGSGEEPHKAGNDVKKREKEGETPEERAQRKAEKRQRKEERRARKEAKRLRKLKGNSGTSTPMSDATETTGTETSTGSSKCTQMPEGGLSSVSREKLRNGRHLLRGRNIQAKRMAFSDTRGLDQIFMIQQPKLAA